MRAINLTALIVFGALWAGLLVVGGAILAVSASDSAIASLLTGGAAAIAAGGFVFQVVVADRLFPMVDRRLADVAETSFGLVLTLAVALTALLLIDGAGS